MSDSRKFFISLDEVEGYHPANHVGTLNRRLIGPETVGAKHLELLHGTIERGKGALPHAHPGIEQVVYMLEGTAIAEVAGQRKEMHPGDCCFFPPDEMHVFTVTSELAKIIVVYSPPYEESSDRVYRPA
jgi:quercetin dioxygenase-like cupin family protein